MKTIHFLQLETILPGLPRRVSLFCFVCNCLPWFVVPADDKKTVFATLRQVQPSTRVSGGGGGGVNAYVGQTRARGARNVEWKDVAQTPAASRMSSKPGNEFVFFF